MRDSNTVTLDPPPVRRRGRRAHRPVVVVGLLLALLLAGVLSLMIGSNPLGPDRVWAGLFGHDAEAVAVVRDGRLPRTVLGSLVGAALGLAGAVMQSITRNPLGDPGLLGVNAGASAAVVSGISFLGLTQPVAYIWFALVGAGAAGAVVYLLGTGGGSGATPIRLALAGTAIQATLYAYVNGVMFADPWAYNSFRFWDIGSLTGRSLGDVGPVLWLLLAGLVSGLALARPMNALALGEEAGQALGVRPGRTRIWSMVSVALLCGSATAAVGPIAFVGLAVPHLGRLLVGVDHRWLFPASAVLGALLLIVADVIGRVIAWPQETGVGIVTAVVGAPVLIVFVRRRKIGRL